MDPRQEWGLTPHGNLPEIVSGRISNSPPAFIGSGFTWEQALRVVKKNRVFSLVFIVVVTAIVAVGAFVMKDFYQPVARIEVEPLSSGMKTLGEIQWNTDSNDENYVDTQTQLLQGNSLAIAVIRALRLDQDPEFVGKALKKYGKSQGPASQSKSQPRPMDTNLQAQFDLANRTPLESIALASFQKRLSVNTIHNTRVIEISFSSQDPQIAQDVLNTLVTQYLEQNFRMRHSASMQASDWLASQLDDLQRKVAEANQAVTEYQKQYGLIELDDRDIPTGHLLFETNHQLSEVQANRIQQEAYVKMIDEGQGNSVPPVRDDPLYLTLMARYDDDSAQLARARSVYGDENSVVKKLESETNEVAKEVDDERNRMFKQTKTAYEASRDAEQLLMASREKLKAEMGDASSHMTEFRVLRNEALATSELYDTLKGRLVEAGIYAGLRSSNLHVVDLAPRLPQPSGPHRGLIIAIGFIVSCVFAVVLSFVRESFSNTIRTPDDLRDWVGLPSLAMLPPMGLRANGARRYGPLPLNFGNVWDAEWKVPLNRFRTFETEGMSDLRTALMFSGNGTPPRVVLVASASQGEGKTTVAMNLAVAFAQCGSTCLVDGDLRRPSVAKAFGVEKKVGFQSVLGGSASLDEALTKAPEVAGLSLLAATEVPENPIDLVASEKMRMILIDLRNRFRFVVVDSPAVISYSDARILSSYADAVILVGRYEFTTRRAITRCTQLLDEVRAPVIGVVLNGIDVSSADYHYYNYGYRMSGNGHLGFYNGRAQGSDLSGRPPENGQEKSKGAHA